MAYQALYRTYRPKNFDEVAGQEHITKTFKNALMTNKLAHAYLFSGPRGTGKTSVAKIIAKAVNCEHAPVANPCNTCDICIGIDKNQINDVIEIDAASNNGVDEIREIRDKVKYLPGAGKYKVYIIDEVHMLSIGAFNALLKTLEEPPKHVIFILATTEPHKIPATIHSRCQRFDFRGVGLNEMKARLEDIIEIEHISISEEAIRLIVESSEGGMRDAISLLDQAISYTSETIAIQDIHAIKGSIGYENILNIALAIENEDVVLAINELDNLIAEGKESHKLVDDLIKFYRDLLVYKNTKVTEEMKLIFKNERFIHLAKTLKNPSIFYYIDILNETQNTIRYAGNSKLYLELAFIKMIDVDFKQDVKIIERLDSLEMTLKDLVEHGVSQTNSTPKEEAFTKDKEEDFFEKSRLFDEDNTGVSLLDEQEEVVEVKEEKVVAVKKEEPLPKLKSPLEKIYDRFVTKKYSKFDIEFIEDVLNTADREEKIKMIKKWFDIERFVDSKDISYAKMITEGTLVATNGAMMIVAFENALVCNKLMKPEMKRKLLSILEAYYQRKLMFMAIPQQSWDLISDEFVKQYKQKENPHDFIKLTPINHPRLIDAPTEEESFADVVSDTVKEAKELFGDIVKVKKGE
jgi:DNA polymerase III subunit gamma/tau